MNDLPIAFTPVPTSVAIQGESITVTPIRVGQLPQLLPVIAPLAGMLGQEHDYKTAFLLNIDACLAAMALMAELPREKIDQLNMADALSLFLALVEVNLDFLLQQVLPLIPKALELVKKLSAQAQDKNRAAG